MPHALSEELRAATLADSLSPILLVQIGFENGAERAWSGYGNLVWNDKTFVGVGSMGSVSEIKETTELQANGCRFTLSGVDPALLALALADARQGLPAKLWLGAMAANGAMASDPYLLFSGLTDVPSIAEDADTATITITAENRLMRLDVARTRRYTPDDQQIDSPGDLGFDYVAGLQDKQIIFGRS
ncbi:MAG: hypothetical protein ABT940_11425 [Alphaproteobacteria bacterium]